MLTADIIGSSRYGRPDRQRLDRILRAAFRDAERRFRGAIHTRMAFRITAGDEFQCVIADIPKSFDVLTYVRAAVAAGGLRPPIRFRASLGIGEVSIPKRDSPYEEDGVAFVRSRRGLDQIAKGRAPVRWTSLSTGLAEADRAADAVLCLADHMQQSWTVPQWEAVRWSVLGFTRQEIARKLGIAHQNVTKRLLAAGWPHFELAARFLRQLLERTTGTAPTVQAPGAPQ